MPGLIIIVGVAYKLVWLAMDAVPFNGDEGIVALMARHILRGERPVFFYGQAYMGSTDAWLVALSFAIFGESVFSIRLVQIALFAIFLGTTYCLAKGFGLSEWGARAALLWMALPPTLLTVYTTATLGGYGETLLMGNLLLLMAQSLVQHGSLRGGLHRVDGHHPPPEETSASKPSPPVQGETTSHTARPLSRWLWLALGLTAGFGFYTFPLFLVYLIPIGLWLLGQFRSRLRLDCLVAAAGFAIGSAPWWIALFESGGLPLDEIVGPGVGGTILGATYFDTVGVRLGNLFLFGVSAWWGLRSPWSPNFVAPLLGGLVLAVYLSAFGHALKRGPRVLWGMIVTLGATYLITRFGGDPSGRLFLPLALPLAVFTAALLQRLRRESGIAAGVILVSLLAYNVFGTLKAAMKNPPGMTTQFDSVTWIDHAHDRELIYFLLTNGETRGYTNYWVQTPIAFLSQEQIISAARLPYHLDLSYTPADDRYPPYTEVVRAAPRAFYITTNHPELNALIRDGLIDMGVGFKEHVIGNYHIFFALSRKVEPGELHLYERPGR